MSAEPLEGIVSIAEWAHTADEHDRRILELCVGPTLDIGCGPGRLAAGLAERGQVALGIDVAHECVGATRERGAVAIRRDVFAALPGEGRWGTALLADGNIGIGGDPGALLRRTRQLIDPRGRVVVELAPPGTGLVRGWLTLRYGNVTRPFAWSIVGVDRIGDLADRAGLATTGVHELGGRWCAVLEHDAR